MGSVGSRAAVDLEAVEGLHDQARGSQHCGLGELPDPTTSPESLPVGEIVRTLAAPEHRRVAARVSAQRDTGPERQRELREPFGARTTILFPVAYGSESSQTLPSIDRAAAVDIGCRECDPACLGDPPLRPERPLTDVSADVGQPERSRRRPRITAGDAAAGARGDEAVSRDPHVAARRDVPAAHFVAALPVLVGVAHLGTCDAHGGDRAGHGPLAQNPRGGCWNDASEPQGGRGAASRSEATAGLLAPVKPT